LPVSPGGRGFFSKKFMIATTDDLTFQPKKREMQKKLEKLNFDVYIWPLANAFTMEGKQTKKLGMCLRCTYVKALRQHKRFQKYGDGL